jgi:hypothetical protein
VIYCLLRNAIITSVYSPFVEAIFIELTYIELFYCVKIMKQTTHIRYQNPSISSLIQKHASFLFPVPALIQHTVTCRVVRTTELTGSSSDDWIY